MINVTNISFLSPAGVQVFFSLPLFLICGGNHAFSSSAGCLADIPYHILHMIL